MKKRVWVKLSEWNKKIVTGALESGVETIIVPDDKQISSVKELGLINVIGPADDSVKSITIKNKDDEDLIVRESKNNIVIVSTDNWKIIPLENIIAQSDNILFETDTIEDVKTALTILEKGVSGVVLNDPDIALIKETMNFIRANVNKINLVEIEIDTIKPLTLGDRVCLDSCTEMNIGQGMLIGSSSQGLFLVHSESIENPYVSPRPFRVNAGGVHSYIRVSDDKTKYLSELRVGDTVLIISAEGQVEEAVTGRVKIEKRPLILVEGTYNNKKYNVILQNAETVNLVNKEKEPVSVVKLQKGDKVLGCIETEGRHFGMKIKEKIVEK